MQAKSFWFEKNVFITGINGFIGGNLAKALIENGANVFGLVRNLSRESFLYFEKLDEKATLIQGDITDKELLTRILSEEQIQHVFHLAAQVEVGVGLENPYLTFETNTKGTYCMMEACRQAQSQIESIVVASTDKSYGSYPKEKMPYKEDYPLMPKYPYDVSKACGDMIAQSYANDYYKLPVVVTRFCNIFGPGQLNFSAIVPDGVRSALGYTELIPRSDGSHIRDFIYVEDVAELYLLISEKLATEPIQLMGEIFNAGTNVPTSVKEVVEEIYQNIGANEALDKILALMKDKKTTGEISCQYMDYEKVNKFVGWKPRHNFKDGIKKSIDWYKRYLAHKYDQNVR